MQNLEDKYLEIFLSPIRKCKDYKPKFGESQNTKGVSLNDFLKLYTDDAFYAWIGLNSPLLYAAHKTAGGMTSIYRQIGVACEHLLREIIVDMTGYTNPETVYWSYDTITGSGKIKTLSLDARLEINEIKNPLLKEKLEAWMIAYCKEIGVIQVPPNGLVFEIRQGYKSKDSKRQNGDIDNATVAWANGYLPIFAIFSAQIDADIVLRYRNNRCGILVGSTSSDSNTSLFAFCKEVLGYDISAFFKQNSLSIKDEIDSILKILLDAN